MGLKARDSMPNTTKMKRIAVIGAGLSGLIAARDLTAKGFSVTLFDKSRGVGGRLSTRYAEAYEFDHGAQYFTTRDEAFESLVKTAEAAGAVAPWPGRALYLKTGLLTADTGGARWVGTPRMNNFAKYLANGLDIALNHRVKTLQKSSDGTWSLFFESTEKGKIQDRSGYHAIICTAPPAQATALLPQSFSEYATLSEARMDACFALMIGLDKVVDLGWDSLRVSDLPVAWLAMNASKPGRDKTKTTLMVHSAPNWSNENVDTDRAEIQSIMTDITTALTRLDLSDPAYVTLHRWLYASVNQSPERPCLVDDTQNLVACGDWCLGGRVEGAGLSGKAAAKAVTEMFS